MTHTLHVLLDSLGLSKRGNVTGHLLPLCYGDYSLCKNGLPGQTYAAANTIMSDRVKEQCGPGGEMCVSKNPS